MGAVKSPQPRNLVVQAVIPVLGQVIGDADDKDSPEEWNPAEEVLEPGQYQGQNLEAKISSQWPDHDVGCGETGDVDGSLGFRPALFIQAERELQYPECDDKYRDRVVLKGSKAAFEGLIVAEYRHRRRRGLLPRSLVGQVKREEH